jgi:hypothetical protein
MGKKLDIDREAVIISIVVPHPLGGGVWREIMREKAYG